MARTRRVVTLRPSTTPERPRSGSVIYPGFSADLGLIEAATQIFEGSVILVPTTYHFEPESEYARWREEYDQYRCWKATVVYEQISENHPHIVPYDCTYKCFVRLHP